MFRINKIQVAVAMTFATMGLVACAPASDSAAGTSAPSVVVVREAAPEICTSCGVVNSIALVSTAGAGTGVGAVLGALVGGVAGNQVGGGDGKKIATVAGVIGGAVVGNKIESDRNGTSYYEVTIDMDGGGQRVITVPSATGLAPGTAVTVSGSNISLR